MAAANNVEEGDEEKGVVVVIRITHIITGLDTGGAEMMLYKLLSGMDRAVFSVEVISLKDIGPIGKKIQTLGIPVHAIGMSKSAPNLLGWLSLINWLHQNPPHVVQTWMYHANLIGGLAAMVFVRGIPVAWNIRYSNFDSQYSKRRTIWTAKACSLLSWLLPDSIVCCSKTSCTIHQDLGYVRDKFKVIPNGFDLNVYRPDERARITVRQELAVSSVTLLIGLVARFDPQKDHHNFIRAAALLHAHLPDVHFLLCGDGINWKNSKLAGWIRDVCMNDNFHLLGRREDIPRLTAALDIASSSSSFGEAFPNIIGEAMACGVPCIVTNVGDSYWIVDDTGKVVPPKNPHALAKAWLELIEMGSGHRRRLGLAARQRVYKHFNLMSIVGQYERLYKELIMRRDKVKKSPHLAMKKYR